MSSSNSQAVRRKTKSVLVGDVSIGGGAPIVVQSMTNTDTADAETTAGQVYDLAKAGSELVRITVNTEEAAAQVAAIPGQFIRGGSREGHAVDVEALLPRLLGKHDGKAAPAGHQADPGATPLRERYANVRHDR